MAETELQVFDYVICGGGTSGCVVASRLAEDPALSILIIEAGEHNEKLDATLMPGNMPTIINSSLDWNMSTKPRTAFNNRKIMCSRGKFLGGSSGCNGTLCIRGRKQDYDDWGLKGWSGEEVFKYMSKAETFHEKPWFKARSESHGKIGPIHIEPHDLAPISELVMDSFESAGLPRDPDMFTDGETAHGCGHAPRTVWNGNRTSAADYVTKDYEKKNITIMNSTTVDKVVLERRGDTLEAVGVQYISPGGMKGTAKARKEVIISGGAYCSPAILLRSGIGPKAEVEEAGVASTVDLPGVGKNLTDHLIVFVFYEVKEPGLTYDDLIYHDGAAATAYELWKTSRTGVLSKVPFGSFAWARLDDRLSDSELWQSAERLPGRDPMGLTPNQPHVELFNTECYGGPGELYNHPPIDHKHVFSMMSQLFSHHSLGSVTLASKNPLENPVVDHNYLDNPLDLLVLSEACRLGNEIVTKGRGTKDVVKGAWPADLTYHSYTKREEWEPYVKQNATTGYHPAGTCKMGTADDLLAVVDEELCVRGVSGLRVVDVSIMPRLHSGHTQMPAFAIGEKAADLIRASA